MRTREERLFIESFIAALSYQYVFKIPFANNDFKNGIKHLKNYLNENINRDKYQTIKAIFAIKPCDGDFQIFKQSLEEENGANISFNNPGWESANIKIHPYTAKQILEKAELGIEKDIFIRAAREFCTGAGIKN